METLAILQFGHTLCHIIRSTFTNILGLHNNGRESDKQVFHSEVKRGHLTNVILGGLRGNKWLRECRGNPLGTDKGLRHRLFSICIICNRFSISYIIIIIFSSFTYIRLQIDSKNPNNKYL